MRRLKIKLLYHRFFATVLLIALGMQSFSKNMILADYYMNTSAYAKDCVNKSKPKMRCKGKCQMMKKMQEQEKKEQEQSERKSELNPESPLSSKSFFSSMEMPEYSILHRKFIYPFCIGQTRDVSISLLRPPGFSLRSIHASPGFIKA